MRSLAFTLVTLCLIGFSLSAQTEYYEEKPSGPERWAIPKFSIKYLPSHYISQFPGHLFELEYGLKREKALVLRLGPVIENGNLSEVNAPYFQNRSGFKSSIGYKITMPTRSKVRPFMLFELFYNDINFDRTRTFELSCGVGCVYYEEATYDVFLTEYGLRINNGINVPLNDWLFFEIAIGLGVKYQDIDSGEGRPMDPLAELGEPFDDEKSVTALAADLSIKLGFVIFK